MSYNREQDKFRTFGRAKGKPLSPAQAALMRDVFPRVDVAGAIVDGLNPLDSLDGPLWLEVGFGGAEHLLWQAAENPDVTILGVEPFLNGVSKAVKGLHDQGLDNIRLHRGDARDVLACLPDQCLDRIFVLFPDPWPKARHNKRRILRSAFIAEMHRVLKPGGTLRFGSDIPHYVDWTLTRLKAHGGWDWTAGDAATFRTRPDDWPGTRYEAKALREGRTPLFFEFIRKPA